MKLYALRSKSLGYINTPFVGSDDLEVLNQLRNCVMNGKDASLIANLKDLELLSLADFDATEGISKAKIKVVIDCNEIPLIAEMAQEVLNHEVV